MLVDQKPGPRADVVFVEPQVIVVDIDAPTAEAADDVVVVR